jgi:DTW domain-containing protein YfiP
VTPLATRTRVLILQHPRERDVPIGTARIARLCLPESELRVGVDFAEDPVVRAALADPVRPAVLLFPGSDAIDVRAAPPRGPVTLVVLDGTWSHAAKLLRRNPALAALPRYRLAPSRPSAYSIRREPAEHCVATIEALAEVLGVLEGDPTGMARLLAPFHAMVARQLEYVTQRGGARGRHAYTPRPRRPRPVPAVLRERADDVVLVYGEANAWPWNVRTAPPPEIVHWTAVRLGSGATFEAVVAPTGALAPSTPRHVELPVERLTAGESFADFAARWRAFRRPDDVLASWGRYAVDVLAAQGLAGPTGAMRLDLRAAASQYLGARAGALDACAARLGAMPPPAWASGRAGRRITLIAAIAARLAGG